MNFSEILVNAGIQTVVSVPDSLNSKLVNEDELLRHNIRYIPSLNEISAVALSSGLNLTGNKTICVFENTGLRYACDIITRFEMAHGIHNMYLLSNRGYIGEENWWGIFHNEITQDIIKKNHMKAILINKKTNLSDAMVKAVRTFNTEQTSIALLLNYSFYEDLR